MPGINCVFVLLSLFGLSLAFTTIHYETTFDYEVPDYMRDFGRPLKTLNPEDVYHDDREKVLEALGPRNQSYLRSDASQYDCDKPETPHPLEEELKTLEDEKESRMLQGIKKDSKEVEAPESYDSGESRSMDRKFSVPLISIWPGWTPFTFDFRTPGEIAMRWTASPEGRYELDSIDTDPNEQLQWDHLIHTPKMIVIDFDYTLTNFSTDLIWAPLKPYPQQKAAVDYMGYVFVPHDDVRRILTALRAKGVKTALIAKERRTELVTQFLECTGLDKMFDHVELYPSNDEEDVGTYLKTLSKKSKIPIRDMIYFDENFQSLKDAFKLGATPQRCYTTGLTMKHVNRCLDQHNQFNIHGVLPHKLYTATGIPGFEREEFENKELNPIFLSTMSPAEYKKEYDKHIEALNKRLKPGHPPFPRWTRWRTK